MKAPCEGKGVLRQTASIFAQASVWVQASVFVQKNYISKPESWSNSVWFPRKAVPKLRMNKPIHSPSEIFQILDKCHPQLTNNRESGHEACSMCESSLLRLSQIQDRMPLLTRIMVVAETPVLLLETSVTGFPFFSPGPVTRPSSTDLAVLLSTSFSCLSFDARRPQLSSSTVAD